MLKNALIATSIFTCVWSYSVHSQDDGWKLYPGKTANEAKTSEAKKPKKGQIKSELHYEISDELDRYINMVDSMDRKNLQPEGFRIQIYSSSGANSKKQAYERQSEFLSLYPSVKSYTLWDYPNWVVRVGNFRTKLEAQEYHLELRQQYPASFIIGDKISIDVK